MKLSRWTDVVRGQLYAMQEYRDEMSMSLDTITRLYERGAEDEDEEWAERACPPRSAVSLALKPAPPEPITSAPTRRRQSGVFCIVRVVMGTRASIAS
jgi:hypothetical protein